MRICFKKVKLLILPFFILIFSLISFLFSVENDLEGEVEIEVVKYIAQSKIEDIWGECSVGPIIKCMSANGNLSSYLVILKLGSKSCPSHDELLLEMDQKQQNYQNILNSFLSINEDNSKYIKNKALDIENYKEKTLPIIRSKKQDIQQILISARRKLWGVGEYCTVVVSANYRGFPIPRYFQGLPAYYVNFRNAKNIASNIFGKDELYIKYYNLGHGGEYFLFTDENKVLIINAYSLEIIKDGKNLFEQIASIKWKNEEVDKQISEAWSYWLKRYREKL